MNKWQSKFNVILNKPIFYILMFILIFGFQIINLDSDPSPIKRFGDYGDEGYWIHNARTKILFDSFLCDDQSNFYIGAPLFTFLEYLSFKTFGISYFSARIVSIFSLWLILIMLFFLMKKYFSPSKALFSVILIGFMHEMLMYSKWATPIILQILFLFAIIFFWELGKRKSIWFFLLSGIAFPLALFSKMTSIYFILPLFLFIFSELLIRKEICLRKLFLFCAGVIVISITFLILFFLHNLNQYNLFMDTIPQINTHFPIIATIKSIIMSPLDLTIFKYPSTSLILILSSFWFFEFFVKILKEGFNKSFKNLKTLELYSIFWIIGYSISMIINGEFGYDRRMVMLIIPACILSVFFIYNSVINFSQIRLDLGFAFTKDISASKKYSFKLDTLLFIIFGLFFSYYLVFSVRIFNTWFMNVGINIYVYFWYILAISISFLISWLYFISKKKNTLTNIILSMFFSVNIILNSIWYLGASYSVRDSSQEINQHSKNKMFFTGPLAHLLAVENNSLPIWYLKPPYDGKINSWFADYSKNEEFLLIDCNLFDNGSKIRKYKEAKGENNLFFDLNDS